MTYAIHSIQRMRQNLDFKKAASYSTLYIWILGHKEGYTDSFN